MRALTTGVGRDGEGEAVDDDAGELLALHVDSLPEAGCAEEDGVGSVAELLEQDMARGRAMQEQRVRGAAGEAFVQSRICAVAGEEAEGAALGYFKHAADAFGGARGEVGIARKRQVGRKIEQRLLLIIEVAGNDELAGESKAEALANVIKA
jgi:hypothetical protein